jgi:hypothetical protein
MSPVRVGQRGLELWRIVPPPLQDLKRLLIRQVSQQFDDRNDVRTDGDDAQIRRGLSLHDASHWRPVQREVQNDARARGRVSASF